MDTVSKDDMIAWLGRERYENAMHSPREFTTPPESAHEEDKRGTFLPDNAFPWDVSDHVMGLAISSEAKMGLLLLIYCDVPTYGLLLAINMRWFEFDAAAHQRFWQFVIAEFSKESSPITGAIEYSLAVDFFADISTAEETWQTLVMSPARNPPQMRRVLACGGYIPIAWKDALYEELIGEEQWHQVILDSLFKSREKYRNAEDKARGRAILKRLNVVMDSQEFVELERRFGRGEEQ